MRMWGGLSGALVILAAFSANAQKLIGTKNVFRSEDHEVVIERFDPAGKQSHIAVMVAHSGAGPQSDWRNSGILEALTTAGYSVFVPHYFDSAGEWSPWHDNPQQFLNYIRTLNDAERYIAREPDMNGGKIGLVGFSLGGYLSLGLAEESFSHPPRLRSPAIKAVVEINAGMPDFAVPRLTKMPPVLILQGEDDKYVPSSRAYDLESLLKKKSVPYEIKVYPHQGHNFDGAARDDANQRAVKFLDTHVR